MASSLPSSCESALELAYNLALGAQIGGLGLTCAAAGLLAAVEEVVACGVEALPQVVAVFLGYCAYGAPFALYLGETVGGGTPVGALF